MSSLTPSIFANYNASLRSGEEGIGNKFLSISVESKIWKAKYFVIIFALPSTKI